MERALATIRIAGENFPIKGAEFINATKVDGWVCVTKKNEFKPGDLGVYFEIDSFLSESDPRFKFLEKTFIDWGDKRGARLMTAKLMGQISQGLFMPIHLFTEIKNSVIGDDVTEILGVEKWEPIIPKDLLGKVIGGLPAGIRSTSQERIQNLGGMIEREIAGQTFEKSIKLDGESMTVFHHDNVPGVASKNWSYIESEDNVLWHVARKNKLIEALSAYGKNIALRGEIIGEGIQENHEKIKGNEFYLFNIFDIETNENMSPKKRDEVVKDLRALGATINQVPSEGFVTFYKNVTIEEILEMADGKSLFAPRREGVVFKRTDGLFSFKAISNWYLLKYGNR